MRDKSNKSSHPEFNIEPEFFKQITKTGRESRKGTISKKVKDLVATKYKTEKALVNVKKHMKSQYKKKLS